MKFQLIYADPPWHFKVHSPKGEDRSAKKHYQVMSLSNIIMLPVWEITEENSVLLMWVTDPFMKKGIEVMEAWGFEYKTVGFYWAKRCKRDLTKWHIGNGYYTRANPETCLLGVKYKVPQLRSGKGLPRKSKSVRRLIEAPVREHSQKPDEAYERIEQLFGEVTRLEMFARETRDGWTSWGNEVGDESLLELLHR